MRGSGLHLPANLAVWIHRAVHVDVELARLQIRKVRRVERHPPADWAGEACNCTKVVNDRAVDAGGPPMDVKACRGS